MENDELWGHIHAERSVMADTWDGLTPAQWDTASWCDGWTVKQTAGHILAAAEQTPGNFYKQLATAGFRFSVFTGRDATRLSGLAPGELSGRLRARTTTTNHPPAPVVVMLGEIVVHGEDIRRPLGIEHPVAEPALLAVAENYRRTNLLIGAKRRIGGLRLRATDVDWVRGDGPEVTGPLLSLITVMAGRRGALPDVQGEGAATLAARM